MEHVNCAAHMLNLVVKNSITSDKDLVAVLEKCRGTVGHFHYSTLACDRFREDKNVNIYPNTS